MRAVIFLGFIAVGAAVGLISTLPDNWGLRVVMAAIGAIAGAAIGGAASRIFAGSRKTSEVESETSPGPGATGDDLVENNWRDNGRPQLTSALEPEHGRHQFDPDRL